MNSTAQPPTFVSSGPQWQRIPIGSRVRKKNGRRRGVVVAIIQPLGADGMTLHVAVRWDSRPRWSEAWDSDCLVILDEPLPFDRFSSRQLATLILNSGDGPSGPNLELIREELRRREASHA